MGGGKNLCPWFGEWEDEINEVVIGEGVTNIGKNAFRVCTSVEKATISNGETGYVRFHADPTGLRYLSSVKISSTVKSIDTGAFYETKALKSIEIPGNVSKIGNYAFYRSGLSSVELNNGLEEIGHYAFAGTALDTINIPGTVKKITPEMFADTRIRDLTINEGTKLIHRY